MDSSSFHTTIRVFCKLFNGSVSSSHRTKKHNAAVGGAANSQHLGWKASDIVLDDWATKNAAIQWLERLGFFVLDEVATKSHIHVDDRSDASL